MVQNASQEQLSQRARELQEKYEQACQAGLQLDMTRGKPAPEQLDLADALLSLPGSGQFSDDSGTDCRNYGGLDGLPEMKQLFAEVLGCNAEDVIVGGSSSLTMMYDAIARAVLFGVPGGDQPWGRQGTVRFLCPAPGYDRHFEITGHLGFELVNVDLTDDGPDMDRVEALASDPAVKGIWCVPRYSNPTGITYSEEVARRLAQMAAAPDFRIIWDNAYAEHHLSDVRQDVPDILSACRDAGHPDRALLFTSTSKMTHAGAGVSAMASSPANIADARRHLAVQTIGPDKLNQLRHLRFFKDLAGLRAHMTNIAKILKPKFDLVQEILERDLGGKGIATWSNPNGGYFVSVNTPDDCARTIIDLAEKAGVKLTPAGAPFAYGLDPNNRVIRLAPSFPPLKDVREAMNIFTLCVELAAIRQQLTG
ncbi:MAG: aminotransferase class I/II-fold pyridoxal phosphate-dependent enzyme [Gammaproteobacteria bacterium]|nr:aminotransferase class I/II-fold pyridoxal phosphate-dependent enzyme [Gammaproteobacteria bacterium]